MTQLQTLDLGRSPTPEHLRRRFRVNWTAVGVWLALALALLSWAGSGARDYLQLGQRVTVLETNRTNDVEQLRDIKRAVERMDEKLDRVLEKK